MTRARWRAITMIVYLLVLVGLFFGLSRARDWATSAYDDPVAQSHWQSFRDDVAQQDQQETPVRRRVPKSAEPPALVLMRDYFATCCVMSVVLTTALFAAFAFFLGGVLIR